MKKQLCILLAIAICAVLPIPAAQAGVRDILVSPQISNATFKTLATAKAGILYEASDTVPTATAGTVYFDLSEGALKVYTGSAWLALGGGSGTWSGVNGGTFANSTNNAFTWGENSEDLILTFSSNGVAWSSTTGVASMAMGTVDDITGVGTIVFDAAAASMTTAMDGAAQDLTIGVTGAQNGSLILASSGTAADALQITTTAGGIDITNGGAASGEDTDVAVTNASLNLSAGEAVADAITITAGTNGGGIDIAAQNDIDIVMTNGAAGEDITISNTGGSVNLTSTEDIATGMVLTAVGVDVTASGGAGKDIDITNTSGSTNISGGEDAADAVVISAGAGGIDIAATGEAAQDVDISNTGGSVNITSTEVAADSIVISSLTDGGGIDISGQADIDIAATNTAAGEDITISNTGGSVNLTATEDVADSIVLSGVGVDITASGGATKDIDIANTSGSVNITGGEAAADGVVITSGGGVDVVAVDDIDIGITSGGAGEDINITQTGANDSSIIVTAAGTGADAISLAAAAGTVKIAGDILDVDTTGDLNLTTTSSGAGEDILITQSGANDSSIVVTAAGTGTDAIALQATAGTLDVDSDLATIDTTDDMAITVTSSGAGEDLLLNQVGGNDSSITITAAGTGTDAIGLVASAGGITIDAAGVIAITSTDNAATAVDIEANGGISETVRLYSNQGTGADSITLLSDEGGITLDAGADDDILCNSDLDVQENIVGDGGGVITGMMRTITADADADTLTIAESGIAETNTGAVGAGIKDLPEASTAHGMQITFAVTVAQNFDINPDDADQILGLTNGAGDAIRSATAGDTVTLLCVDDTNWVVVGSYGTWSDVN